MNTKKWKNRLDDSTSAFGNRDCFAVCRKFHEQSSVSEHCCSISDWCYNRDDSGQLYERC